MSKYTGSKIDDLIISRASDKDTEAMRALYDEYSPLVWNLALKFTGNLSLAEDAAAEVFIRLFKKLKKYRGYSSFRTWLYRLTVNTVINFMKKERRRSASPFPENIADSGQPPESMAERDMVRRLLEGLSDEERRLVILREMEGMSYREISEILNLSLSNVKTRIYRARIKLRELYVMEDEEYEMQ